MTADHRTADHRTALLIIVAAVLGAVATVLTPALFESFQAGRLVAVLALAACAILLALVARRNRNQLPE